MNKIKHQEMFVFYDLEIANNYALMVFKFHDGSKLIADTTDINNFESVLEKLYKHKDRIILTGYNNKMYDSIILEYWIKLLNGDKSKRTKENYIKIGWGMNCKIIIDRVPYYQLIKTYDRCFNQFDLMSYCGYSSLKETACKIQFHTLENLPFNPEAAVEDDQIEEIKYYCENDVDICIELFNKTLRSKVEAKVRLIDHYGLPLHHFMDTDKKITEILLVDKSIKRPVNSSKFKLNLPMSVEFESEVFSKIQYEFQNFPYIMRPDDKECVTFTSTVNEYGLDIEFGGGGLHAIAQKQYEAENITNIDVTSLYPSLIIKYKLYAQTIKDPRIFEGMINERVKNKKTDPSLANAQKVPINAYYGSLGEDKPWNPSLDHNKRLTVCVMGQLLLSKLIEMLALSGAKIVQANTDGLMIEGDYDPNILKEWETKYGFDLVIEKFKKLWIRDVTNYAYLDEDDNMYGKGSYNLSNPLNKISGSGKVCILALLEHLKTNKSINSILREHENYDDFALYEKFGQSYHSVMFYDDGKEIKLGGVVRFYWIEGSNNYIDAFSVNRNTGAPTKKHLSTCENIKLLPKLGDVDTSKIDYKRYEIYTMKQLTKLTNKEIEDNDYIKEKLDELKSNYERSDR